MKNEWDFFADVLRRLAEGQRLVLGYLKHDLHVQASGYLTAIHELRGPVQDEDGISYELGDDFKLALDTCIRANRVNWGLRYQEGLLYFGPDSKDLDEKGPLLRVQLTPPRPRLRLSFTKPGGA